MTTKVTEIEVSINCKKCKTGVLKVVAKLTGVDEVKLDAEKGILTVVGSVDPVSVAASLRNAGYSAEITSFGPPKKPNSPEKPKPIGPIPQFYKHYQPVGVTYVTYEYDTASCSIL